MAKSKPNKKKHGPSVSQHLSGLDGETRSEMQAIWNQAGDAHRKLTEDEVSDADMELALYNVRKRIEAQDDHPVKDIPVIQLPQQPRSKGPLISVLLAAALALFALGFGWMSHVNWQQVPAGETLELSLRDGSTVTLNSGSEIGFNRLFGYTNRSVRLNGEAYFQVQADETPFLVRANDNVVQVLGTSFNLRSWHTDPDRLTTLSVTSGQVEFFRTGFADQSVVVDSGKSSSLSDRQLIPTEPVHSQAAQPQAWLSNQIAFSMQPLSVIFDELARKFDVAIEVNAADIEGASLSIFYTEPQLETILAEICTVKNLEFSQTANGFRIHR
ncbi:FecR family protein [Cyclonatronum proteinivorum]|nr:FecR family protein [Cyclonatronum proteinivorum]